MVNHGRSKGCITCKQRRVKCDQGKPQCRECQRVGRPCEGYRPRNAVKVRFKDETVRYSRHTIGHPAGHNSQGQCKDNSSVERGSCASLYTRALSRYPLDIAVPFFLRYIATSGRSTESTRGHLDYVPAVLSVEPPDSALHAAVEAVAFKLWTRLTAHNCGSTNMRLLNRAISRLRSTISDPDNCFSDGTAMAALLLQLHDTLSAIFDHDTGRTIHREGAIALIRAERAQSTDSTYYNTLLASALHHKVSFYFRERGQPPAGELEWLRTRVIPALPPNPSSLLDIVGLSVVNIQHNIDQNLVSTPDLAFTPKALLESISQVDSQLHNWLLAVPDFWYPTRIKRNKLNQLIPLFSGACDVYPSVHIATIWNVWRTYRVTLAQIKLQLKDRQSSIRPRPSIALNMQDSLGEVYPKSSLLQECQTLLDDMCYSIPFYLGDRSEPTTILDMEDRRHNFPSYHELPQTDVAFLRYQDSDNYLSKGDHHRHVALQGPFHLASILSHLIPLITEHSKAHQPTDRRGQMGWVSEQLARTLHLLRLDPEPMQDEIRRRLRTVHVL